MSVTTQKGAGSDSRLLHFTQLLARKVTLAWHGIENGVSETYVRQDLLNYNFEGAIDQIMQSFETGLGDMLAFQYIDAAREFTGDVGRWIGQTVSFNPTTPQAVADARDIRHYLRQDLDTYREALRVIILRGLNGNNEAEHLAEQLIGAIGLTPRDVMAIESYSNALNVNDKATALETPLRDRRYDSAVRRGILTSGQKMTLIRAKIKLTKKCSLDRLARTQAHRVVNMGRHALLLQLRDHMRIADVRRIWRGDPRSDRHSSLVGQVRTLDIPFETDKGQQIMYPGDPRAPAEHCINCQCWLSYQF